VFMTGNIENQKTWINAKMNLARASPNKETRRREEEILNRIILTGIMNLDKTFKEEDEEETDDLSEY
jgi:DNA-binding MurR/RpiR family transcriptional regulator